MKLKKLIFAAASAMLLAGCSNVNEPTVVPQEEEYVRAFIKKVGVFDGDHNWCAAQSGAITIMPENEVKELKVYGYTDGEYYLVADYSNVTKPETIRFDMPTGTESVMVIADGVSYSAPINGYIDLSKAQGMAMPSRAGNVNDEGYTWIIAVEDLGGAYDFDFNDAVIGLNTIQLMDGNIDYTRVKFTALAAGGTLPLYLNFDLGVFELYTTVGKSSIDGNRLYPDGMDVSKAEFHNWFGSGYDSSTMINTGKGPEVSLSECKSSTIYLKTYHFYVSDYASVYQGKISGLSLEVVTPNGTKTIANPPTKTIPTANIIFEGVKYYYSYEDTCFYNVDVLKNMKSSDVFEIVYSIKDGDETYAKVQVRAIDEKGEVKKYNEKLVMSENLKEVEAIGEYTVRWKPSNDVVPIFKEGNMSLYAGGITLKRIAIVESSVVDLTPVKERDYLTAPQMFIIPDKGNDGKWQWPTETTCIVDAYSKFADWCKKPNKETNEWHLKPPVEGTTISR